jgi:hypothetical protein
MHNYVRRLVPFVRPYCGLVVWSAILMVTREPPLLSGTIAGYARYAYLDVTRDEVIAAQLHGVQTREGARKARHGIVLVDAREASA